MKNIKVWAILLLVIILFGSTIWFRLSTMKEAVITPTSYSLSKGHKDENIREVFAVEGEYRIKDSWFPLNFSSGTIANKIDQAVKYNNNQSSHAKMLTCKVKTFGVRFSLLSWYPVIYETDCQSFN